MRFLKSQGLILLGLAISAVLLLAAGYNVEWHSVGIALASAQLWPWLPLAVGSYLIGHWVRGVRTRLLVSRDAKLSLVSATNVVVIGYTVNNILPARLGEFARAGMLSERTGLPVPQSLTVTLVERTLDGWVLFLYLCLSLFFVPTTALIYEVAEVAGIVFAVVTVGILLVLIAPNLLTGTVLWATSRFPDKWRDRIIRLAIDIVQGLEYLRSARDAAKVLALSAVVWLFEAGLFFFLLPAFGIALRPDWALLALAVTNLGILVPSTPGYVVVFHYFCQEALRAVGVGLEVAVSYSIVVHLGFFIPITLWGVGIILWYGIELSKTISMAKTAKPLTFAAPEIAAPVAEAPLPPRDRPDLFLALAEALVPTDRPRLEPEERRVVVSQAADFLQGQINALSPGLQTMMKIALTGFRFLVRLRFVRGYCELPLETRRRIADWWAYGPIGFTRQMFRALRATVLLAYWEHPIVGARMKAGPAGETCR